MDRAKVKEGLTKLSDNLNQVRNQIATRVKRGSKCIVKYERALKKMKKSVVCMKEMKASLETTIVDLSEIRNALSYITNETVDLPEWNSSSDVDTDMLSSDSSSDEEVFFQCMNSCKLFYEHIISLYTKLSTVSLSCVFMFHCVFVGQSICL